MAEAQRGSAKRQHGLVLGTVKSDKTCQKDLQLLCVGCVDMNMYGVTQPQLQAA